MMVRVVEKIGKLVSVYAGERQKTYELPNPRSWLVELVLDTPAQYVHRTQSRIYIKTSRISTR